jgi:hypothetical protein
VSKTIAIDHIEDLEDQPDQQAHVDNLVDQLKVRLDVKETLAVLVIKEIQEIQVKMVRMVVPAKMVRVAIVNVNVRIVNAQSNN